MYVLILIDEDGSINDVMGPFDDYEHASVWQDYWSDHGWHKSEIFEVGQPMTLRDDE